MSGAIEILYEDNHCIAVAKPAPLLTQGVPPGIPTLEAQVKSYLRERYKKPGNVYLGIPHRLDRPVSGVVLFARQTKAAQRLAEQFQKRQIRKVYLAIIEGDVQPSEETWEDWLLKCPEKARTEKVEPNTPGARHAMLNYKKLLNTENGALVRIELGTGRMHQIRIQTSVRGHPILGDVIYGSSIPFGPVAELPRDRVIALHARSLTFLHPIRYEPITVTAPLPEYWKEFGDIVP